jgi:hypothetical protein
MTVDPSASSNSNPRRQPASDAAKDDQSDVLAPDWAMEIKLSKEETLQVQALINKKRSGRRWYMIGFLLAAALLTVGTFGLWISGGKLTEHESAGLTACVAFALLVWGAVSPYLPTLTADEIQKKLKDPRRLGAHYVRPIQDAADFKIDQNIVFAFGGVSFVIAFLSLAG